jgi:hypothetical protein
MYSASYYCGHLPLPVYISIDVVHVCRRKGGRAHMIKGRALNIDGTKCTLMESINYKLFLIDKANKKFRQYRKRQYQTQSSLQLSCSSVVIITFLPVLIRPFEKTVRFLVPYPC